MSWDKSFLTDSYLLFGADYESAGCHFVTLGQTVPYWKNGIKNDFLPITTITSTGIRINMYN